MNIVKNIQDINKKSIISATAFWLYGKLCGKINNSNNDIERKYKIIFTSFAFKKIGIEPRTMMNDVADKSYNWSEKYNIYTSEGNRVQLFGGNNFHINYQDLTKEDFKDPAKLKIAQKIYKDFSDLGMLGKEVSYIFGVDSICHRQLSLTNVEYPYY